jgi:hypothetical protein
MCWGDISPFLARGTNDKYLLANGTPKKYNALDYFLFIMCRAHPSVIASVAVCVCLLRSGVINGAHGK